MGGLVTNIIGLTSSTPRVIKNMPANHAATILIDGTAPSFIIQVPAPRVVAPNNLNAAVNAKPILNTKMMGWMVSAMANFWPFWEGAGITVQDVIAGNNGTFADGSYGSNNIWWAPTTVDVTDTPRSTSVYPSVGMEYSDGGVAGIILETPIKLSGEWSIDLCWRIPYTTHGPVNPPITSQYWNHVVITHNDVNGIQVYLNGVLNANWWQYVGTISLPSDDTQQAAGWCEFGTIYPELTLSNLFQIMSGPGTAPNQLGYTLEYVRVWRRVLNLVEIQTLYADPFCMFGITQEMLDEITKIIQFMTPYNQSWFFVFN